MSNNKFPKIISDLPIADIPIEGLSAFLFQGTNQQIIFMEFDEDVESPEHTHAAQMGVVLEGKIELIIDGEKRCFTKGDRYFIPAGVKHSGKIFAGYADITFFDEPNRYSTK